MWGEGASELWGHLEGEDAAHLKPILERRREVSSPLDEDENAYIAQLGVGHSAQSNDLPHFMTVELGP
jgi:hypothetical protein